MAESPEQRRARIRAEATANQDNPFFRPRVVTTARPEVEDFSNLTPEQQSQRVREQIAIKKGAYDGRRYLSDPPVEYKQPIGTAAVGELGEDEKERTPPFKRSA